MPTANSAMPPFQQDYDWLASLKMQKVESSKTVTLVAMLGQLKLAIKAFIISTVSELVHED